MRMRAYFRVGLLGEGFFQQWMDRHTPKILPPRTTDRERNLGRIMCFRGSIFLSNGQGLRDYDIYMKLIMTPEPERVSAIFLSMSQQVWETPEKNRSPAPKTHARPPWSYLQSELITSMVIADIFTSPNSELSVFHNVSVLLPFGQ